MTAITIHLPEETLTALREEALLQGRLPEEIAAEQLVAAYLDSDAEAEAIKEAFDELELGKGRPFEEFVNEYSTRFVSLTDVSIGPATSAELRTRLASFAEDWNQPEMEIYDNYVAGKSALS